MRLEEIATPDFFRTKIVKETFILVFYNKILLLVRSFPIIFLRKICSEKNCSCNSKNPCSWYAPLKINENIGRFD